MQRIDSPTTADVLLGNNKKCREHCGNQWLRWLCENAVEENDKADKSSDYIDKTREKRDKGVIKQEIVNTIKKKGGRFLEFLDGRWVEVSERRARYHVKNKFSSIRRRRAKAQQQAPASTSREEQHNGFSPFNQAGSMSDHESVPRGSNHTLDGEEKSSSRTINSESLVNAFGSMSDHESVPRGSIHAVDREEGSESLRSWINAFGWLRHLVGSEDECARKRSRSCEETGSAEPPQRKHERRENESASPPSSQEMLSLDGSDSPSTRGSTHPRGHEQEQERDQIPNTIEIPKEKCESETMWTCKWFEESFTLDKQNDARTARTVDTTLAATTTASQNKSLKSISGWGGQLSLAEHAGVSSPELPENPGRLVLERLSRDGSESCKLIAREVLESMSEQREDAQRQSEGLLTLVELVGDADRCRVVRQVLDTMNQQTRNAVVQQYGFSFLRNVASHFPDKCDQIFPADCVDVIKAAMEHHDSDAGVLTGGCLAITCLAKASMECQRRLVEPGVVELLKRHQHLLPTWWVPDAMKVLAPAHIRYLVSVMINHPSDAQIHTGCMGDIASVLADMTTYEPKGILNGLIDLVPAVIAAMKRHESNPNVQENGLLVLRKFAHGTENEPATNAQSQPTRSEAQPPFGLSTVDVISVVLLAMNGHPNHEPVQRHGSSTLVKLVKFRHLREIIRRADGHRTVINSMCRHATVFSVRGNVRLTILEHLSGDGRAELIFREVMTSMSEDPDDAQRQTTGLLTLVTLLTKHADTSGKACFLLDAVAKVLKTMDQHQTHAGVQNHGCSLLAQIASRSNLEISDSGIDIIKTAMELRDREVRESACWAFTRIARASKENRSKLRHAGVVKLLQHHKSSLHEWDFREAMEALKGQGDPKNHMLDTFNTLVAIIATRSRLRKDDAKAAPTASPGGCQHNEVSAPANPSDRNESSSDESSSATLDLG